LFGSLRRNKTKPKGCHCNKEQDQDSKKKKKKKKLVVRGCRAIWILDLGSEMWLVGYVCGCARPASNHMDGWLVL
jgi:hypothetical protein